MGNPTPEEIARDEDDDAPEHLVHLAKEAYRVEERNFERDTLIEIGIRFERRRLEAQVSSLQAERDEVRRENIEAIKAIQRLSEQLEKSQARAALSPTTPTDDGG